MLEKNKVSVVVPVYNSHKYIETTLNNLINQTYKNLELILVDDGSSDGSAVICDRFSEIDSRVKVIHQENAGICAARNVGLLYASGEYIMFSDDDDEISIDAVETAVSIITMNDADIVKFAINYVEVSDTGKEYRRTVQGPSKNITVVSSSDFVTHYETVKDDKSIIYIWNGIYRKAILGIDFCFNSAYKFGGEDFDFNCRCFCNAKKIIFSKNVIYTHYKRGNHSTAAKYNPNQVDSMYMNYNVEEQLLSTWNAYNDQWQANLNISYFMKLISIFENPKCQESRFQIKLYILAYRDFLNEQGVHNLSYRYLKHPDRKTKLSCMLFNMRLFDAVVLLINIYRKKRRMIISQ